jgi:hypothetical protein
LPPVSDGRVTGGMATGGVVSGGVTGREGVNAAAAVAVTDPDATERCPEVSKAWIA